MRATLTVVAGAAVGATAVAAVANVAPPPHVSGGATVPVYSYEHAIRESVWVETPTDTDLDGVPDRVAADLIRPREAGASGVKVPVIMVASPYYQCCGRGNEPEFKQYAEDGTVTKIPLFYDNYFVPRGYAVAAVDLIGTSRSTGCEDVGGPADVAGAKAVVDWLNGRARGFAADGREVTATAWTTGRVGMIGKSWDGSVANGVAATGVRGLATIVPIGAISNWYDYARYNGIVHFPGRLVRLHNLVNGRPAEACASLVAAMRADTADETGDYNAFWAARNYLGDADRVRASVFIAHGLNDRTVTTPQFGKWWTALAKQGVQRKIWLYQAGHADPFDVRRAEWVDTLHRWFDRWLQGLHNGIDRMPRASLETAPGQWAEERDWPAAGARPVVVHLGDGDGTTGTLSVHAERRHALRSFTDIALTEQAQVRSPSTAVNGRLAFLSGPLSTPLRLSGTASVLLRVRVDRPTAKLTVRLVDYGTADRINYGSSEGIRTLMTESCWGQATATDDACYRNTDEIVRTTDYGVLTRGWLDTAHYLGVQTRTPMQPGHWYTVTLPLAPYEAVLPVGHVLGLVVSQSDGNYQGTVSTGATVGIDLAESELTLPVVGGHSLPAASTPPTVRTTRTAAATEQPLHLLP